MKSTWFFLFAFAFGLSFFSCTSDGKSTVATASVPPSTTGTVVPVAAKTPASVPGTRSAEEMVTAGFKRYGVEKGALIFRIDGAVQGTEHIFFDNWGWREAKYTRTTTKIGTFQEHLVETQYLDGERRYVYTPETKKANYFDSPQVQQMADKYQTKDMVAVGNEMLKKMGGKPAGTAKVGDLDCEIWKIEQHNVTLYMWQGLTMREESYVDNYPVGRRCVQIELEKDMPLDKLLLPKDAVLEGVK